MWPKDLVNIFVNQSILLYESTTILLTVTVNIINLFGIVLLLFMPDYTLQFDVSEIYCTGHGINYRLIYPFVNTRLRRLGWINIEYTDWELKDRPIGTVLADVLNVKRQAEIHYDAGRVGNIFRKVHMQRQDLNLDLT